MEMLNAYLILMLQFLDLFKRRLLIRALIFAILRLSGFLQSLVSMADDQELGVLITQKLGLKRHPATAVEFIDDAAKSQKVSKLRRIRPYDGSLLGIFGALR